MKLAFSALAVAMVLGSASAALAAHHKSSGAPKAPGLTANAQAGSNQIDPRPPTSGRAPTMGLGATIRPTAMAGRNG